MYIEKKCVSSQSYLIKYPEFNTEESGEKSKKSGKAAKKAADRMNLFYSQMKDEIISYANELGEGNRKAMYIMNSDCQIVNDGEEAALNSGENVPLDSEILVKIALTLRLRPEPTRRKLLVHKWRNGYLLSVNDY